MKYFSSYEALEAFSFVAIPLWVFDLDQHSIWWGNDAALKLWGVESVKQLCARDFSSDSPSVREKVNGYFDSGKLVTEVWTFYPDDKPVTKLLNHQACRIGPNKSRGMICQAVPIDASDPNTDPERLWMSQAMRYTSLMVTVFDLDGMILCENPSAATTYAHLDETSSDESDFVQRFVDTHIGRRCLSELQNGTDSSNEYHMSTRVGDRIHSVDMRHGRDPHTGNDCCIVSEEDVTDLRRAIIEAEEANKMKSEFCSTMSHELRTPLNAIIGFAETLGREDLDTIQKKRISAIYDSGIDLLDTLNDILDLSKIEAGAMTIDRCMMHS